MNHGTPQEMHEEQREYNESTGGNTSVRGYLLIVILPIILIEILIIIIL